MESEPAGADFQRARKPEQREVRRRAILDAAQELLSEFPAADISLREIARRLGGSKSGIVRYYETREALFLELLQRAMQEWLDEVEHRLPADSDPVTPREVAEVWATSLAERPMLAELWSMLPAVLERNVSAESIRSFKLVNRQNLLRLAGLVAARLPGLSDPAAVELANASVSFLVGLWPFANPTPTIREAIEDPRLAASRIDFVRSFSRTLEVLIAGLIQLT
ncbi:MAG: TetR-family transcriptional regulator [Amycolatopsis sp.]|uniref:TetR/AcrR family transcriptional regulator n=1 Tax=Amycolatopsis sp. TaxID=37632 RepID=UPI002637F299|nr:TetR family transcriptional regulator [Amycolatopsis sp.]MCU1686180.1 TetR-family transcriptional regulator [Amycolatopsis sp.]